MAVVYSNNASTALSSGITNSATSITVGSVAGFPTLTGSDYYYATLANVTNTKIEIVKVTAAAGNTLTVVRGQDNTTAVSFDASDNLQLRVTAATLESATSTDVSITGGSIAGSVIDSNTIGADALNVSGNGTAGQYLGSDADGTFTWTSISSDPSMGGDLSGTASNAQIVANAVTDTELNSAKLDGIEALADVTDTANVTAAGAAMLTGATFTGDVTITDTTDDSAAGPELSLARNSTSPADGDYLGQLRFDGKSDTGTSRLYAKMTGKTSDVSNGSEDGLIETAVMKAGTQTIVARQTHSALKLINGTGLEVAGNITVTGTVDGRDVATDGTKLDGIATAATANGTVTGSGTTSGTNTGDNTVCTSGTATTAATLATARTIAGVSFDGSANISLNNNAITNGAGYTTNVGDITGVTAGTGMSGGGTSGTVTLNCTIDSPSEVGLGNLSSSGNALSGTFTATGDIVAFSDKRLKENVEVIPDALSKVKQLNGYTFTRNDLDDTTKRYTGVIAQEVLTVLPEAVVLGETSEDTMSVAYGNMMGLMIEAIKELEAKVEALENK
jgi:hypothetical protein